MNEKVKKVLMGYVSLSREEQLDFNREINSYNEADGKRKMIKEGMYKEARAVSLGPKGSSCPCCGR